MHKVLTWLELRAQPGTSQLRMYLHVCVCVRVCMCVCVRVRACSRRCVKRGQVELKGLFKIKEGQLQSHANFYAQGRPAQMKCSIDVFSKKQLSVPAQLWPSPELVRGVASVLLQCANLCLRSASTNETQHTRFGQKQPCEPAKLWPSSALRL